VDEVSLVCPCCDAVIGIEDDGRVVLLQYPQPLADNERKGIGGIRTEHSGDSRFYEYQSDTRSKTPLLTPLHTQTAGRKEPQPEPESAPVIPDEKLMEAAEADLKKRFIK
jgi:hypothetical protein